MARPKPLADLIAPCLGRALAAQGFAAADVIVSWPEIAGERLAAVSRPLRIERSRLGPGRSRDSRSSLTPKAGADARPEPATLLVRVEGAFALELQHLAPVLIERVNAFYGWRCVGRIALRQGPVRLSKRKVPVPSPPTAEERARIIAAIEGVGDTGLRDALASLGEAVLAEQRQS